MPKSHRTPTWTRRRVLGATAGGTAAAAVGAFGTARAASAADTSVTASGPGDVVGKVTVGYQGWFACKGDGAPINAWWHWSPNSAQPPSPSNHGITSWPDVRDYTKTYTTAYANLGNGRTPNLFSSHDQQTVDTHFLWMQQYGIDTAALQRFNPTGGEGPTRDAMTAKVRSAAEAYGRKFYIMYDVTSWTNMQSEIKTDWTNKMSAYTSSPAYAKQNGKPVVCVWGFGFNDAKRDFAPAACLDVVNWFKNQGCYVIGGVPTWWRTGNSDSRPGFSEVYHAFNMISPWMVGRIGKAADSDNFYNVATVPDMQECAAHGIDYQPCVLPGDVAERQRAHGDFMWRQFYNVVRAGVQGIYISMYDEYNEGNQIAKTAESQSWIPTDAGLLGLDEDGTACSADYYLRLTGDGGRMLKGELALTATRPTQPYVNGTSAGTPAAATITLKARANGKFVTAESGGTKSLIANRDSAGAWERCDQIDLGGGTIALRSRANGRVVTADNAGAAALIANRTAIGPWETFQLVRNSNGTVSLLAAANGKYVTADNGGADPLIAGRTSIGTWEQFDLATV
ncbi:lectin [Streptomyces spinoverrucosus]|uniref:xylosidase n=1 Tax=Streptomyces spinoverrucosus TaxID=284043 RepID=UPI001A23D33A|nr:xylosidase [Streptomyces spinoverrucosus]MBG0857088.1 lectin [Streptomyces spinoverrucosus]